MNITNFAEDNLKPNMQTSRRNRIDGNLKTTFTTGLCIATASAAMAVAGCQRHIEKPESTIAGRNQLAESHRAAATGNTEKSMELLYDLLITTDDRHKSISQKDRSDAYALMGHNYDVFGDYESARECYEKSLSLDDKSDYESTPGVLYGITIANIRLHDKQKSQEALSRLRETLKDRSDALSRYRIEYASGMTEKMLGSQEESLRFFHAALAIAESAGLNASCIIDPMLETAIININNGETQRAFIMLDRYRKLISDSADVRQKADYMKARMRGYTLTDQPDSATAYQDLYFILTDSIRKAKRYQNFSDNISLKNAKRNEARQVRNQTEQTANILTVFSVLSFIVLSIFFTLRHQIRKKRNRNLLTPDFAMTKLQKHICGQVQESKTRLPDNHSSAESIRKDLFDKIRQIVERRENFSDPDFSLPRVADAVGVNVKYVSDSIKEHTGYNFRQFLNSYRVSEAQRRLIDDEAYRNQTIQSIAESVGFKAASAFIAAFKKFTGMTPSAYAKEGKQNCSQQP